MKVLMIKIIVFFLFFQLIGFSQNIEIKSLRAFTSSEIELPVLLPDEPGSNLLHISFDIDAELIPNLNIIFRYCDRNWNPVDNIFLLNQGQNTAYNLDFLILPNTVEEARYHFRGRFPDTRGYVSFPFSGKWKFFVTDSQDTSKVYASGKFFVIHRDVNLNTELKKELLEDRVYYPLALSRAFTIETSFDLPEEFFPNFVDEIEIIENKLTDYPYVVDRSFNTNYRQFYWDGSRKFSFNIKDIRPGNEYRQVDLRNFNRFNSKNVRAQFDGIETSRFFKFGNRDLNGGYIFTKFSDEFATYLNVRFDIRPPEEITGPVFIVGAFNDWKVLPEYELKNSGGLYSITIPLKRGIYDYKYVTADIINDEVRNIDWLVLEGNFWETTNEYYIFLYYNDPNYGGYDRIVGYQKIISN
jgi:hypothetical protein